MGRRGWGIVGFAVAIVGSYIAWTAFLSPEARVARTVDAAVAAAESVDADAFLSHFGDEYGDYLHASRALLEDRVREAFGRVDRLNVTLRSLRIEVEGDEATARFELTVVAFRGEERYVVLGTPFQPELVRASMWRGASGWEFVRAEREVVGS